ncbi:hypothetical protein [Variovorax rhizosphaerae]|uniref:Uncharacterized protein n=1 Tax=Variovorax rhizosphaerae TaxID=1836200 RepID=A0ABU8WTC8_9BURK
MEQLNPDVWIAACAHRLQLRWRSVDPSELEEVADGIWHDERLRAMGPSEAAAAWLKPIACDDGNQGRHRLVD